MTEFSIISITANCIGLHFNILSNRTTSKNPQKTSKSINHIILQYNKYFNKNIAPRTYSYGAIKSFSFNLFQFKKCLLIILNIKPFVLSAFLNYCMAFCFKFLLLRKDTSRILSVQLTICF